MIDRHSRISRRRWTVACVLGVGVLVNYFDRVNLSVSHEALNRAFGLSDVAFGYLSSSYNVTYALCQLPVGVLLDRLGVRRVGRLSTLLWSVASFAAALTPNLAGLFGARLVLGVGESPTFPANAKAIGLWFPQQERGFATSIFDAAAKLASAIGVPLIGLLLVAVGWRWSFAATGLISLLYFWLFSKLYRDPGDDVKLSASERSYIHTAEIPSELPDNPREHASLSFLLRQRKVLGLALGLGAYNYTFYLLVTWLPSYLSFTLHVDLVHSFLYTGVPWLFATFCNLAAGISADRLIQRGWSPSGVRKTMLAGGTTLGLGILGAAYTHSTLGSLFWVSVAIGGLAAASPIGWSIPSMIVPRQSVGKVGGIVNFSNQLSGIAAPIVTGYVLHASGSYIWAFRIAAIYLAIGIFSYFALLGAIEPIRMEGHA